jgi:hypothetical protein
MDPIQVTQVIFLTSSFTSALFDFTSAQHTLLSVLQPFEAVESSSWMEEHMTFGTCYCDGHPQAS